MYLLERRLSELLDLLLMVVRFVAHGDLLFSELYQPLSVDPDSARDGKRRYLVLKNTAHMVKQSAHGQHDRGGQVIPAVQEELSVLVALSGRL